MPVTINGTTGIAGVDGSASTPAVQGTDTNTGIFFPAADTIAFGEGGAEVARFDSSGNLGIGTSSPNSKLSVAVSSTNTSVLGSYANIPLLLQNTSSTDNNWTVIAVQDASGDFSSYIGTQNTSQSSNTSIMAFATNSGSGATERARITSGGDLLVGTTTSTGKFTVSGNAGAARVAAVLSNTASDAGSGALLVSKFDNTSTTSQVFVAFAINNNAIGSGQINANGASQAAFGSYSDSRLKENITDLLPQLANICALRPVEFDYIQSEGGGHQISFIAQEFEQVYPEAVGQRADGMKTLTGWGKTEAYLVKAIQELKAITDAQTIRIETLEAQNAAFEARLAALEVK